VDLTDGQGQWGAYYDGDDTYIEQIYIRCNVM